MTAVVRTARLIGTQAEFDDPATTLVRTAAENGVKLDLIGADEPDSDDPGAHVVLCHDAVQPRTVEVALEHAGAQQFQCRAADFVGWAKRG